MTDEPTFPDEAAALLRGDPDRFTRDRDALAATLRDAGRNDDAAAVKRLRKPTVVAWALNQLVERDPDGVRAVLEAGAEVRAAQQAALSSKRGASERLRTAGTARKTAVSALAAQAVAALNDAGRGAASHEDAIVRALETCSTDPTAGAELEAGSMQRPPAAAPGFGDVLGLTALEGGSPDDPDEAAGGGGGGRTGRKKAKGGTKAKDPTAAELRAEVARLRRDRDGAARRATKARSAADGFAHELDGMRRRLEVVERKHAAAEAAASEGEVELARVDRELRRATDALDGA